MELGKILFAGIMLALIFGCVQDGGKTTVTPQPQENASETVEENDTVDENVTAPENVTEPETPEPVEPIGTGTNGEVALTVISLEEIELETLVSEVRVPNPVCYPDAEQCGMMDEPMHIFEEKTDIFYNVSSPGDPCLLSPQSAGEDELLYVIEYSFENQDSQAQTVEPGQLRVETELDDEYLVTTPNSGSSCTSFFEPGEVTLAPSESQGFKAVVTVPESETPLKARYYVAEDQGVNIG
jgi:hypothetical protein